MRISIWQQFSSNHSASFTLVGKFESVDAAQKAAEEIRGMLSSIEAWYERPENAELSEQRYEESIPPSPVEKQFAEQYGVEWNEYSLDWIMSPAEAVAVLDKHVIIDNMRETWLGPKPIDEIMEKLGGIVSLSGEAGEGRLLIDIEFKAPDEMTATSVFGTLQKYFVSPIWLPCPWQPHATMSITLPDGKTITATAEEQLEAQEWYRRLESAATNARAKFSQSSEIQSLSQASMEAARRGDFAQAQALSREMADKLHNIPEVQRMQQETTAHPEKTMTALQSSIAGDGQGALSGKVSRDGPNLSISRLSLVRMNMGLPLVLQYLREQGCQNSEYQFTFEEYGVGDYDDL